MAKVAVHDTSEDLIQDIGKLFQPFGGVERLASGRDVLIKPNGVHYLPGQSTDTAFLDALIEHLRGEGARNIFLMENCTAGNLTRVVFSVLGWDRLCKRHKVVPVYLDEGRTREVTLPGEDQPVRVSEFLASRLLDQRDENFYLSVPRLKTHSMSHVTLGIKNQMGFLVHEDRMKDHNYKLGEKLVRILSLLRPDFTLIEGVTATVYGHFPIMQDLEKSIVKTGVLIAGPDAVAVDTVGAKVLGYEAEEIDHIKRAGQAGLGCADLSSIEVIGSIQRFTERYPYMPEIRAPDDVKMIYGKEMACYQGCRGNTEIALHMFANDYQGKGGFNLVMGKGIDKSELEGLSGHFLVIGPCAAAETAEFIRDKYPDRKLFIVPEHNDLANMSGKLARLMRPSLRAIMPLNPVRALWLLLKAKRNHTTARLINPF